ncbi:hypothetical protein JCM14469_36000 [Desulfatiferula olefinivorans]
MDIEVGGQIQGISLGSFLQIVHMDKTTCTLKIYSNDDIGYLYLKDGALVAAETGKLEGVEAAYEILSWNKAVIIIDNAPIPNQKITMPLMSILMEGLRRKDEKNAQMGVVEEVETKELEVEFDPDTYVSRDEQIASQFVVDDTPQPTPAQAPPPPPPAGAEPPKASPPPPPPVSDNETPDLQDGPEEAMEVQDIDFEGEDESHRPRRAPGSLFTRILTAALVLSALTFGGLYAYKIYIAKQNYQRVIDQVLSQKNPATMKSLLNTYINAQDDDNAYIMDAIGKMNDVNLLIEIERKIADLSLDDDYKKQATTLFTTFLKDRPGTFLEPYIRSKISGIPKIMEAYDYKKLAAMQDGDRKTRMSAFKNFLADYPDSGHKQAVKNMMAAISDEYYTELSREIQTCNQAGNWDSCIRLADDFIRDFPADARIDEIREVRDKMTDRAEFADMMFRSRAMGFADAKSMFIAYLQKKPETSLKKEIRNEISLLNRKIDFQSKWEETRAFCTNPNIDVQKRIRELSEYIERDYSGLFKEQSSALMKDLKEEEKIGRVRMAQLLKERQEKERLARIQAEKDRIAREREEARLAEIRRKEREKRLAEETVRITGLLGQSGGRFKVHPDRTVTDTRTGLIWCLIDSHIAEGECMTFDQARDYIRDLTTAGYRDWRMPDTSELAILYNSRPYYPSSGASWYWTRKTSEQNWGQDEKAAVFFPDRKDSFEQVFKRQSECGYIHAVRP